MGSTKNNNSTFVNNSSSNVFLLDDLLKNIQSACEYVGSLIIVNTKELNILRESFNIVDKPLDINKFKEWVDSLDLPSKDKPIPYFKKCFEVEYPKGTFDIKHPVLNVAQLFIAMRKNKIVVYPEDTAVITVTLTYLYENKILTIEEIKDTNVKIIDYMSKLPSSQRTSTKYFELLQKSNILKGKYIDWVGIGKEATQLNKEWNSLYK